MIDRRASGKRDREEPLGYCIARRRGRQGRTRPDIVVLQLLFRSPSLVSYFSFPYITRSHHSRRPYFTSVEFEIFLFSQSQKLVKTRTTKAERRKFDKITSAAKLNGKPFAWSDPRSKSWTSRSPTVHGKITTPAANSPTTRLRRLLLHLQC